MESKNTIIGVIVAIVFIILIIVFRKPLGDLFRPTPTANNQDNNSLNTSSEQPLTGPQSTGIPTEEPVMQQQQPAPTEPAFLPVTGVKE